MILAGNTKDVEESRQMGVVLTAVAMKWEGFR
jgi:hypothetical protein